MLSLFKKLFADRDGAPAGSTTVIFAAIACAGTGEWKYALSIAILLIGTWTFILSGKDVLPNISSRARLVLGYGWMVALAFVAVAAYDYRSAFFMSCGALAIPLAAVLISRGITEKSKGMASDAGALGRSEAG